MENLHAYGWLLPCFGVALLGTWLATHYARWRNLVDHPGERRSHATATPRGGGIGIVVAMLCAMAGLALHAPELRSFLLLAGAGLGLVAGIGWLDDHRPLSPWWRLAVHAIAAAMLAWAVFTDSGDVSTACVAFLAALALVNIWNFMDGLDGIAGLQAVIVAAAYACIGQYPDIRWLALALAVAVVGFLPFNLPRARIFLGDVGSGALGYALAMLMAMSVDRDARIASWMLLLLPPSAFLLDASLTLASRILRRERWWTPHVEHAYQRWARRTGSHLRVTLAYAGWSVVASVLTVVIHGTALAFIIAAGIAWYLGGGISWMRLRGRRSLGLPRT